MQRELVLSSLIFWNILYCYHIDFNEVSIKTYLYILERTRICTR